MVNPYSLNWNNLILFLLVIIKINNSVKFNEIATIKDEHIIRIILMVKERSIGIQTGCSNT